MKKVIGYVLSGVGLFGLAISQFKPLKDQVASKVPDMVFKIIGGSLVVISIAALAVGVFFLFTASRVRQKGKEVPIYKGKEIVGYRVA
ncbi:MAG: hypothetical protein WCP89_02720 [archaeon]